MKKALEINMENNIITECWNCCRLAAYLTSNNMAWYIENFIELIVYDGYLAFYYEVEGNGCPMPHYEEIIEHKEMKICEPIVPQIISAIDHGGYPIVLLHTKKVFGEEHEVLFIGYDTDVNVLLGLSYEGPPEYWKVVSFSFDQIESSFQNELIILNNDIDKRIFYNQINYPASIVFIKQNFDRKVNLIKIYETIFRMLYSGNIGVRGISMYAGESMRWIQSYRGVEIYKLYYNMLYNELTNNPEVIKRSFETLLGIKKLLESKKGFCMRMKYLQEYGYIPNIENLEKQCEKLCEYINNALKMLEKFRYKRSDVYLEKMQNYFRVAEILDKMMMEQFLKIIKEGIDKEWKVKMGLI